MDDYICDVPEEFRERFRAIVPLTDEFCRAKLDEEYRDLAREMAVAICQEGSPVRRGKPASWACGIIYSLAQVNFTTYEDSVPHVTTAEIASGFGLSQSTMQAKSRLIREGLEIIPFDPNWCTEELLHENPLVWMHEMNGFVVDLRTMDRKVQVEAFEQGLIPYIHADRDPSEQSGLVGVEEDEPHIIGRIGPDAKSSPRASKSAAMDDATLPLYAGMPIAAGPLASRPESTGGDDAVFELKVTLKNTRPPIWRRFVVPAHTPLDDLHHVLQSVMGWYDCHLHQFILKDQTRYGPRDVEWDVDPDLCDETQFRLSDFVSRKGDRFTYEYDFGDDWEHRVELVKILSAEDGVNYPVCLKGRRRCPPEDCGGPWGYMNLLSILDDPKHPEHAEWFDWAGGKIDPEEFDLDGINDALAYIKLA